MELLEGIKARRSVRKFDIERQVEDDVLKEIIQYASWAPSAHNGQSWKFVIIRDHEKKQRIAECYKRASNFLIHTPVVIAVVADFSHIRSVHADDDRTVKYYCIQDTAAAIQNLLLAAFGFGLGTCWIGDFDEKLLKDMLAIPDGFNTVGLVALGYPRPGKHFPAPRRKPIEEILSYEAF